MNQITIEDTKEYLKLYYNKTLKPNNLLNFLGSTEKIKELAKQNSTFVEGICKYNKTWSEESGRIIRTPAEIWKCSFGGILIEARRKMDLEKHHRVFNTESKGVRLFDSQTEHLVTLKKDVLEIKSTSSANVIDIRQSYIYVETCKEKDGPYTRIDILTSLTGKNPGKYIASLSRETYLKYREKSKYTPGWYIIKLKYLQTYIDETGVLLDNWEGYTDDNGNTFNTTCTIVNDEKIYTIYKNGELYIPVASSNGNTKESPSDIYLSFLNSTK